MTRIKPSSCPWTGVHDDITVNPKHWFGIAVLSRPLFAWFGHSGVIVVSVGLLSAAVTAVVLVVGRRRGLVAGLAMVVPVVLTGDFFIDGLFSGWNHGLMMAVGLAGVAVIADKSDHDAEVLAVWAFGVGCVFNYFNMFSFVPGVWAMSAAAAGLYAKSQRTLKAVCTVISWPAGFALMWGCKWLIAAITLGTDEVISIVVTRFRARIISDSEVYASHIARGVDFTFGEGFMKVWELWFIYERLAIAVLFFVLLLLVWKIFFDTCSLGAEACVGPAAAVVCSLVVNPHMVVHAEIYDFRVAPMMLGAIAAHAAADMMPRRSIITTALDAESTGYREQ